MKIGYRRYSGKVILNENEVTSPRGNWFEKRKAFIKILKDRGHMVDILTEMPKVEYDYIFIEFGSLNAFFNREDIILSQRILADNYQKTIFLLDDPELMPKSNFKYCWVNADPQKCSNHWNNVVLFSEFPFHALQTMIKSNPNPNTKVVYFGGTSGGRERKLIEYSQTIPLDIYGNKKDYKHFFPKEPPLQNKRQEFYNQFFACLNVQDRKHKKLGWNTGRYYHSIMAGTPAYNETIDDLYLLSKMDMEERTKRIVAQQESISFDAGKCIDLLKKFNL